MFNLHSFTTELYSHVTVATYIVCFIIVTSEVLFGNDGMIASHRVKNIQYYSSRTLNNTIMQIPISTIDSIFDSKINEKT